jgi:dTDP-4-amino-4,6-dideoxygalactose transaminase
VTDPLVPLFDLRLEDSDIEAVGDTLRSGWLTMGPRTQRFEEEFAAHLGVRHAVALSSCTAALHLAYLAAGVGPGDEVIVPAITFVASAAAVHHAGGTPVLADILGPSDLGIDPADVEARITARTKAVCVVHYAGYAAAVEELRRLCDERGLALIEDAAHAPSAAPLGSEPKLGTYGLAGAFSFFSNKVLSCGEGGLLATDDDSVAEMARAYRSHAMTATTWDRHRGHSAGYDVVGLGFNYRMDEPRAALLSSRLLRLEREIAARRRLVHRYRELLADVAGLLLPYSDEEVDASSCYVMPAMLEDPALRDPLREHMRSEHAVQTSVLYPAIHEFTAYRATGGLSLPRSELAGRAQITLPLFPHLTEHDQGRVVRAVGDGLEKLARASSSPRASIDESPQQTPAGGPSRDRGHGGDGRPGARAAGE